MIYSGSSKPAAVLALFLAAFAPLCAQNAGRANFGAYPADYRIAYLNKVGLNPTVRDLYGPGAAFATKSGGVPCTVTLESSAGTAAEFTAQILMTMITDGKRTPFMRLLVRFEADRMAQMSYVRYLKVVNLVNGNIAERDRNPYFAMPGQDEEIAGFFIAMVGTFWDADKYRPPPSKEEVERQKKEAVERAAREEAERQQFNKDFPLQTTVTAKLYADQDFNAPVVTTLARGARVKLEGYGVYTDIDGETAKWARITTPDGKTGWVFSGYLADAPK